MGLGKNDRYLTLDDSGMQQKFCRKNFNNMPFVWSSFARLVEASIEGQSTFGMEGTAEKKKESKVETLHIVETASTLRWTNLPAPLHLKEQYAALVEAVGPLSKIDMVWGALRSSQHILDFNFLLSQLLGAF